MCVSSEARARVLDVFKRPIRTINSKMIILILLLVGTILALSVKYLFDAVTRQPCSRYIPHAVPISYIYIYIGTPTNRGFEKRFPTDLTGHEIRTL